ncbi:lantibiotic dehydratase [Streptomyces sp. Je 1-4]|uniref:lantibiotic dehydratase n=1 Tax=Streptomyces TaxID=1883 RepID=UPI0021DAEC0A|nr:MULTISPECIES: lantibiotic dehydratase [unclassified Streptomyces]UYB38564.1 lantibiotic dehydratase [Streptomyces sp. Je 1-4]UZQ34530.1 lantibiotic dehydratase [Streptomyces sp. Je 1-4] [Streptomyces sp. Je 1-4 4N24]UZQ41948.1 lantibiotic dehydratase [Streptomyces sp. Je 1-4] [Streptomyces sp. Je 1-4 4N24_ara]
MSDTGDAAFACGEVALVRAAALPLPSDDTPARQPRPSDDVPHEEDRLRRQIAELAADPRLMEAVSLASASLAAEADRVVAGERLRLKSLRRIAMSLTKYRSRMSHRPTPFGLFAGVGLAGFGPAPAREPVGGRRSVTRPDAAWLDGVLETLREVPAVLERSRLTANNLHTVRNGRLVLVDHHDRTGERQLAGSVRDTRVVRHLLAAAACATPFPRLVEEGKRQFPQAPEGAVESSIVQLVRGHFLLTDLTPPPDCTAPLDHVRDRLHGVDHPTAHELHAIHAELRALDAAPPGGRRARLTAASARMRALQPAADVLQTDLSLDVRLTLPEEVAREAARAATVLWRTSPVHRGNPHLRDYHLAFLERYGTDRPVPVLELLDDARGLGLPRPYREPGALSSPESGERDRVLGELLMDAARRGAREVVLDEETVRALEPAGRGPAPLSMEVGAELLAPGWEALCDGDFHLVLAPQAVSPLAGAMFSRFAPVLGRSGGQIQDLALHAEQSAPDGEIAACVAYRPRVARSGNVSAVPQWLSHRLPLGVGPAAAETAHDLRLEHLAVHADTDGLRLVDGPTGRRVRPLSYSMLHPGNGHLPYVARFLLELGQEGRSFCAPWSWGSWASAPALPRVRHGRTVLSPAQWLPDRALRAAADQGDEEWSAQAGRWRRRWGVPRRVLLTKADHRVAVDLDDPLELLVLRDEVRRATGLTLVERFGGQEERQWFQGPEGSHAAEFVFPVFARPAGRSAAHRARQAPPVTVPVPLLTGGPDSLRGARTHLPGGEWLYAKIYVPRARQPEVLARHLGALTDPELLRRAGADLWFFLRYEDPVPHIRLRFHGKPESLWPVLLPELHSWARVRAEAGLLGNMVLDTYEPEVERYGGPAALGHAERVFHADSESVVTLLAMAPDQLGDPSLPAALGILDILTRLGSPDEALSRLSSPSVMERRGEVPRARKQEVAALLDAHGRPRPPAAADGWGVGWSTRGPALAGLREVLSAGATDPERTSRIALSLTHMHCNRLLGPLREQELTAHVTAREALALWLGRKRNNR